MASEEIEHRVVARDLRGGPYLLVFDPLDGSSNIDINVVGRHDLSRCWRPHQLAPDRGRLPAAGPRAGGGGLCDLRAVDDARAHRRPRHARLHARSRARPLRAHACRSSASPTRRASSRSTPRTHASGSAPVQRYVQRVPGRRARRARGSDFNMRWIASHGRRRASHPDARRRVHVPARLTGDRQGRPPAAAATKRTRWPGSIEQAGGWPSTGRERILDLRAGRAAPARAGDPRLRDEVERTRALSPRTRPRRGSAVSSRRCSTSVRCSVRRPI